MPLLWPGLFVWSPIGSIQLSSCGSKFSFLVARIRKEWGLSRQSWRYIRFNYRLSYMAIFTLVRIQEESVGTLLRFITGEALPPLELWLLLSDGISPPASELLSRARCATVAQASSWEFSVSSWERLVEGWRSCLMDVVMDACSREVSFEETLGARMDKS